MLLLGFSISGATLLLASLAVLLFPLADSPMVFVTAWLSRMTEMIGLINNTGYVLSKLFGTFSGPASLIWVFFGTGLVSLLAVLWLVSFQVLSAPRSEIK